MLRNQLEDKDIPHRDTIRERIMEILQEHLNKLHDDMSEVIKSFFLIYCDTLLKI